MTPPKAGDRWASDVAAYWRDAGLLRAKALHATYPGEGDRGDVGGIPDTAIECKNITRDDILTGLKQAERAALAQGRMWAWLFKKQRRRPVGDGLAVCTIDQAVTLTSLVMELRAQVDERTWCKALATAQARGGDDDQ